jgi:hypothetical protein
MIFNMSAGLTCTVCGATVAFTAFRWYCIPCTLLPWGKKLYFYVL